jgi:predicted O-linked N-acetylglucosamine transferase (SPINDLY family)
MARRALELSPDSAATHSTILFMLSHCCNDPDELTREHFKYGERWEAPYLAQRVAHPNERDPERRLRVGFVSGDLYYHALAYFIEGVLEHLKKNGANLALHVYYTNTIDDPKSQQLRGYIDHWHEVADLDDEALASKIRADEIDILIDLSGHSALNRLLVFARKPAPVQASWIGYGGTTGLQAVDYFLADPFYLPEGRYDSQFKEQIVRIPLGAPFQPDPIAPPVGPLPALANGHLTFGCFHRPNKIGRDAVAMWGKLLRALPDARLVLAGVSPGTEGKLLAWLAEEGVGMERLEVHPRMSTLEYMKMHHKVDICFAPIPYSGSTTICHALWMGVPTLTKVGPTNPSHASVHYLAHLGLNSFIAQDDDNFVNLGVFLSKNIPTLAALRAGMRERYLNSLVGYPGVAAATFELALRKMWRRWCAGLPPEAFKVSLSELVPAGEDAAG